MVWWIVGGFGVVVIARALFQWHHGVLPPGPAPVPDINDPQLGVLTRSESGKCWECRVSLGNTEIDLSISGKKAGPDAGMLQAARDLVSRGPELLQSIKRQAIAAVPSEADAEVGGLAIVRTEMLSLVVDRIHIYNAGPPLVGMVFFKENPTHEGRIWHCSLDGDRATDFCFDS